LSFSLLGTVRERWEEAGEGEGEGRSERLAQDTEAPLMGLLGYTGSALVGLLGYRGSALVGLLGSVYWF